MKLSELSNKLLRYMAKSYADTHKRFFGLSNFQSLYPELDVDFISDALKLLKCDGFISIFYSDNLPCEIELLPLAIHNAEEDTMIKKGYTVLKEIRSWL